MLAPIILVIVFTLLNGFFSGSEMAFINADERKLEKQAKEGDRKAKLALTLNRNQNRVLAVVQVAITLIGTLNSAFATSGLSEYLTPYFGQQGAAIVISLVVTLLTLIFGELLPKSIGQAVPESFSRIASTFINLVYIVFKPVYDDDPDNIIGFLLVKDYLRAVTIAGNFNEVDIRDLVNDPLIVPETLMLDDLFEQIQMTSSHIAIVKDEYGQTSGIITLEDIIEEIVGEIYDEYDNELHAEMVEEIDDSSWVVNGLMNINDFNERFNTILTSNEVDTMGGYFTLKAQIIPSSERLGTVIREDPYEIELTEVIESNVSQLKVTKVEVEQKI